MDMNESNNAFVLENNCLIRKNNLRVGRQELFLFCTA